MICPGVSDVKQYLARAQTKRERAQEFLKEINLNTYRLLENRLRKLGNWEEDDKRKLAAQITQLKSLPTPALAHLFGNTLPWKREAKRNLYRVVKADIESWLDSRGYSVEDEILSDDQAKGRTEHTGAVAQRRGRFQDKFLKRDQIYGIANCLEGEAHGNLSAAAALGEAQRLADPKIISDSEFSDEFENILQGYYDFKKRLNALPPR